MGVVWELSDDTVVGSSGSSNRSSIAAVRTSERSERRARALWGDAERKESRSARGASASADALGELSSVERAASRESTRVP